MKTFEDMILRRRAARRNWGKDLVYIEDRIPLFIQSLNEMYSPSLSASKAGFNWQTWRQAIIQRPEVRAAYDEYMDAVNHRRYGLMGGL